MSVKILADQDFGSVSRITGLLAPVASSEPVRLADLNSAVEGISWKDNVVVATSSNTNLASPGAALDGITMVAGDRFLARGQTLPAANGIYLWNGAAVAATRTPDASTADELENAVTTVDEGTDAGTTWRQTAVNFVLGTDPIAWVAFGTTAPSASETVPGIIEIATQAETDTGTDDTRAITPLKLATYAGRLRKFAANIGDGAATQYDVTHNLGTVDTVVSVRRVASPFDKVVVDDEAFSTNVTRIRFSSAPTTNQFRVTTIG